MVSWKQALFVVVIAYFLYRYFTAPTFDPKSLKNKVVIVTGASRGIGEQLAYEYAKHGSRLIIAARSHDKLEKVKKHCLELGSPETHVVVADFSKYEDSVKVHEETMHIFGKADVLILNHALTFGKPWKPELLSKEILHRYIDTNYISYVALATLFSPELINSGGSIGVMSSTLGFVSMPNETLYSATKHAVHGFFDCYYWDLICQKVRNVTITMCVLGPIGTQTLLEKIPPNSTHIKGIPISSPKETAVAILQSVAMRLRLVYIPYIMKLTHYFSFFTNDGIWDYLLEYPDAAQVYV